MYKFSKYDIRSIAFVILLKAPLVATSIGVSNNSIPNSSFNKNGRLAPKAQTMVPISEIEKIEKSYALLQVENYKLREELLKANNKVNIVKFKGVVNYLLEKLHSSFLVLEEMKKKLLKWWYNQYRQVFNNKEEVSQKEEQQGLEDKDKAVGKSNRGGNEQVFCEITL